MREPRTFETMGQEYGKYYLTVDHSNLESLGFVKITANYEDGPKQDEHYVVQCHSVVVLRGGSHEALPIDWPSVSSQLKSDIINEIILGQSTGYIRIPLPISSANPSFRIVLHWKLHKAELAMPPIKN